MPTENAPLPPHERGAADDVRDLALQVGAQDPQRAAYLLGLAARVGAMEARAVADVTDCADPEAAR